MEQKAAHTPGPWSLTTVPTSAGSCHQIGPFPTRRPDGAPTFACLYADGIRIGIDDRLPNAIELAANARLIAAAPDLLEIALAIVALCGLGKHADMACMEGSPLVDAARAAIAKAEGGAA